MFPVTSNDEMRGTELDVDAVDHENELIHIDAKDLPAIWDALMARLLSHPGYVTMFQAAYPDVPVEELGFEHAANAIAAFEIDAYTMLDSPWDRYLSGEEGALSEDAKQGALLFYGEAGCSSCHSGNLLTDQEVHCLAVPQVGPGKGDESPLDFGRMRETGNPNQRFAFRTPPLRNVAVTGPWMHDGAFSTLEATIRHHINPAESLLAYDPTEHLPPELVDTFQDDPVFLVKLAQSADIEPPNMTLRDEDIDYLLAFLDALTDPAVSELDSITPDTVPSGLPVTDEAAPGSEEYGEYVGMNN
jgi:cytochrome c peroxidase